MKISASTLAKGGVIAALYTVLTLLSTAFGLSSGAVQIRLSEALWFTACLTPAAVPGLFLGCVLANLLSGCLVWDVVFGSLATLLGAIGSRLLRKRRILACLPPILCNALIVPLVLVTAYRLEQAWWLLVLTVGAGEAVSCGILGQLLYGAVLRRKKDV